MTTSHFIELIEQARQGDSEAATRLVREYEPHVRRVLNAKINNSNLRHHLESEDLCQSVMGELFLKMSFGLYEVNSPEQLLKLLFTMAKNKFMNQANYLRAQKRDALRTQHNVDDLPLASDYTSPSVVAANRELADKFQDKFSDSERFLVTQRKAGVSWESLAEILHRDKNALRAKLDRAIDRISMELGLSNAESKG